MKNAISFVEIGECRLELKEVEKKWTLLHRIVKHQEKYQLLEYTPKGKLKLKVNIQKEDANFLASKLNLRYIPSDLFHNSGVYLKV